MSYSVWKSPEKRVDDSHNETVTFEAGYLKNRTERGWFCTVTMNSLCVEDFGITKRSALKLTRRSWKKAYDKKEFELHGYPRVVDCEEKPTDNQTPPASDGYWFDAYGNRFQNE